jgi:hypothetical protein
MKNKLNVGDWCFYETELCQIKEIKNGRASVTNGIIITGNVDVNQECFPLDIRIKRASTVISAMKSNLHKVGINGLNHPDISRKINSMWVDMCSVVDDEKQFQLHYDEIESFISGLNKKINELKEESFEGVYLFRR